MATYSSILAWRIPWTGEPGRLQSMGWQRVRHDWAAEQRNTIMIDTMIMTSEMESVVLIVWNPVWTGIALSLTQILSLCIVPGTPPPDGWGWGMKAHMWGRGTIFKLTLSLLDGISPLQPGCLREMPNQKGLEAHDAVGASSSFPSAASAPLVLWGRGSHS